MLTLAIGQGVCVALVIFQWARLRQKEAELRYIRTVVRDHLGISNARGTAHDLLRVVDQSRPIGASLRECLDAMKKTLDEGRYP